MPANEKSSRAQQIITKNKALDKIIVSVSSTDSMQADADLMTAYMEDFSATLLSLDSTKLISKVETKQDDEKLIALFDVINNNLPFLLQQKDYLTIDSLIQPAQIEQTLQQNYATLANANGLAMKQLILKDPLGISMPAFKKLYQLKLDENVELYDGYISNKENTVFTFFIYPTYPASQTGKNEGLEKLLNQTKHQLQDNLAYKQIRCDLFGAQMVAAGNAIQMRADTILTLSITIILLVILFFYFFRNLLAPLQIMIPVVFGGLFGMCMMYITKGSVSLIALGASSVILGIAVNYSLHFMSHLKHAQNKEETIRALTQPMTIGSFTTIFAFLSLTLVHTPVLQELGLFAAFNLMGSSVCTLVFLPHFVAEQTASLKPTFIDRISLLNPNKNKWVVIAIAGFTILLAFFMNDVKFNEDMMKMNYMSSSLKKSQDIINERNSESLNSTFSVSEGNNWDEALQTNAAASLQLSHLKEKGLIKKYLSINDFILTGQEQSLKLQRWNTFWTPEKKAACLSFLKTTGSRLGYQPSAFAEIEQTIKRSYSRPGEEYVQAFKELFKDFIIEDKGHVKLLSLIKTNQENRSKLYASFQEDKDTYLTDKQLITTQFVKFIQEDFYTILALTSLIVFFTILLTYGRIEIALISFIPMVITWICILGLMAILHVEFNIINIIISTLIFGLGDDYSIFITDGLIEKYKFGTSKINSIKTSIFLSALTTVIGLGILIFAKHPALRSIALVSVIGIFSILFVSQTIQPLLFNFFIQNRTSKKLHPFTLWSFAKTIFAFFYYVTGCMMVTLVGFILIRFIPALSGNNAVVRDRMKYAYHVVICKMMWSLLYIMGNVRKRFDGREHRDFSRPSVIIANHASFLDLLRIISLHPKILLMTNQWVWRSPVFGALVRLADYYPVEEGAEFSIDKLKYWVERGYSIAVFPAGTRSYDDKIKRFHKGAFYIAEKLQLDIQPILFHGIGYSMSKGDFLLKNGEVNARYLPRITTNDARYGTTYAERARNIGKYFRNEFTKYKEERETPAYFKEQLIKNYIYKGPVLEWYCRIKARLENYYTPIEKLVPREGNILDIGCGYGFLAYILSWTSENRTVYGLDYDEEKIEVAKHNFSKTEQLHFTAGDALDFSDDLKYDCILIMDVLHYLLPEKQLALLQKCKASLAEKGLLIVRDGVKDLNKKHQGTVLTEIFSTRIFGFNKTKNELHFISKQLLENFAEENQLNMQLIDDTKFTSNIVAVFS
ncbi:MAG: methyltransferase domain-containing protein, partial [Chitinophagaceae bacterium]|nr:methyltransferase domain-containing protein [Chitinophagaceae bacterium]